MATNIEDLSLSVPPVEMDEVLLRPGAAGER